MTIGERIRQRRIELGMTQEELAKKAGYQSRSSINKLESARVLPSRKIELMAKALECSPAYLMGWFDADIKIKQSLTKQEPPETDEHKVIIEAYEKADDRTRRMILYMLNIQDINKK